MKSTKASRRHRQSCTNGSHAMSGVAQMRATVSVLGRFTAWLPEGARRTSGERLEHQLAHGLQRIEHAVAGDRDRLEVGGALDPFARRHLLDEVLACMIRIGRGTMPGGVADFPARVQRRL